MTHSYRATGVYLTEDETPTFQLMDGYLTLNPYWFWQQTNTQINHHFSLISNAAEGNLLLLNCKNYIKDLIT
jgi:hypothetical protein